MVGDRHPCRADGQHCRTYREIVLSQLTEAGGGMSGATQGDRAKATPAAADPPAAGGPRAGPMAG